MSLLDIVAFLLSVGGSRHLPALPRQKRLSRGLVVPINEVMSAVDWDTFGVERLAAELRGTRSGPDAEKMIFAFEEAVRMARIDEDLLDYLLVATCCLLARVDNSSPREILETFFRRSLTTEEWREHYLPLLA
jgi:hypothetical protein